jgi:hypothetical protein
MVELSFPNYSGLWRDYTKKLDAIFASARLAIERSLVNFISTFVWLCKCQLRFKVILKKINSIRKFAFISLNTHTFPCKYGR